MSQVKDRVNARENGQQREDLNGLRYLCAQRAEGNKATLLFSISLQYLLIFATLFKRVVN